MSLQFNFDPLRVFEVVDNDLPSLFRSYANRMTVSAETDRGKRCSNFDLFDLFTFYDIIEENAAIKSSTA